MPLIVDDHYRITINTKHYMQKKWSGFSLICLTGSAGPATVLLIAQMKHPTFPIRSHPHNYHQFITQLSAACDDGDKDCERLTVITYIVMLLSCVMLSFGDILLCSFRHYVVYDILSCVIVLH